MPMSADQDREVSIIALWESAAGLAGWRRDDALLGELGGQGAALGARNATLLGARGALFGRPWPLASRCPACGTACEFEIDSISLAEDLARMTPRANATPVAHVGRSALLRAPTANDLRAIAQGGEGPDAMRALLARCLTGDIDVSELTEEDVEEFGETLEALDPGALVRFELVCPDCQGRWQAAIDIGEAFWQELSRAAEQSLLEVDALARAYGWTEAEVLALSPTRRAAYLQLVGAS